jgi:exopolyphosphatase/guanosine-5'-triphosphate,3'-diphosphate pyrophosphatase
MRVGIVDVGSNTVRLLVAERRGGTLRAVREERERVGLGADVERHGELTGKRMAQAVEAAEREVRRARRLGAAEVAVLLTSPGRQAANGAELAEAILAGTGALVRLLSAEDEGHLGYAGAIAAAGFPGGSVAVCDAGGGSTQIAVGSGPAPSWVRSVDIGSLRLAKRFFTADPPSADELDAARDEVERSFGGLVPPLPRHALATGGTARALARIVGRTLDAGSLAEALEVVSRRPAGEVSGRFGIPRWRAAVLPAGALVLARVHRLLGLPLDVARGGLREGAALELLDRADAADLTA